MYYAIENQGEVFEYDGLGGKRFVRTLDTQLPYLIAPGEPAIVGGELLIPAEQTGPAYLPVEPQRSDRVVPATSPDILNPTVPVVVDTRDWSLQTISHEGRLYQDPTGPGFNGWEARPDAPEDGSWWDPRGWSFNPFGPSGPSIDSRPNESQGWDLDPGEGRGLPGDVTGKLGELGDVIGQLLPVIMITVLMQVIE